MGDAFESKNSSGPHGFFHNNTVSYVRWQYYSNSRVKCQIKLLIMSTHMQLRRQKKSPEVLFAIRSSNARQWLFANCTRELPLDGSCKFEKLHNRVMSRLIDKRRILASRGS